MTRLTDNTRRRMLAMHSANASDTSSMERERLPAVRGIMRGVVWGLALYLLAGAVFVLLGA